MIVSLSRIFMFFECDEYQVQDSYYLYGCIHLYCLVYKGFQDQAGEESKEQQEQQEVQKKDTATLKDR